MTSPTSSAQKPELDIGSLLERAWKLFSQRPGEHIIAGLLVSLIGGLSLGILAGPMLVGYARMCDKQRRGETIAIGDVFGGFDRFGAAFVMTLVIAVVAFVGFIFLVLPGLVVLAIWAFAPWYVALKDQGAWDALGSSYRLFKANLTSVVIVFLLLIVLNSAGAAVLFASLFTFPFGMILATVAFAELD